MDLPAIEKIFLTGAEDARTVILSIAYEAEMGSNKVLFLYLNTIFEYLYLYLYLKVTCYEYLHLYLNISEVFQKHQILQNTFKYNVL